MNTPDVVLIGYYGQGNFGDDILMVVAHALAQKILPGAEMALRIGTSATYPEKLLGSCIGRLPFGTRGQHRLIVHGGGGTFFDFSSHNLMHQLANTMMLAGGVSTFVRIESALRHAVNRQRLSARTRFGLGLGIGTFSPGSPKLLEALSVLSDFDALWVRDHDSVANLSRLGVSPTVVRGSDLAFLWEHWCPPSLVLAQPVARSARPRVGVILRDWPTSSGMTFAQGIKPVLEALSKCYELTLLSLDPATDAGTLRALPDFPRVIWQPESMNIGDFVSKMADQDVLLTSRAHGAICGACLGRPSVILGIEPKLKAVHEILPNATRLLELPLQQDSIIDQIEQALAIPLDSIAADVLRNRSESEMAMASILAISNP